MSEPQFGRQEEFLTEEELFEFRFLTTALAWTNPVDENARGETNSPSPKEKNRKAKPYRFAAGLTELLVRHVEVVAVTASNGERLLVQTACDGSDDALAEDEDTDNEDTDNEAALASSVDYAQSLREEYRSKIVGDAPNRHPALDIRLPQTTADAFGPSIGSWLLSKTEKTLKAVTYPKTSVSFSEHAANLVKLIKDTYEMTTTVAATVARRKLRNYVLLTSTAKIVLRIKKGTVDRNLYEYLSKSSSSVSDHITERRYSVESVFLGTEEWNSTFTESQRKVIISAIYLLESKCAMRRDYLPERSQEAFDRTHEHIERLRNLRESLESGAKLVYDEETLLYIQDILSLVLDNLVASIERLALMKRQIQLYISGNWEHLALEHVNNSITEAGVDLDKLAAEAGDWLHMLTRLKQTLRPFLFANFELLRKVYALRNVKKSRDVISHPGHPTLSDLETEQLDSIAEGTRWEGAAMAWLDLVCLHWTAFLSLSGDGRPTRHNSAYKAYVQKAGFQHFEAVQEHRDRHLDVKSFLDDFTMETGKKITKKEGQRIRTWLLKNGYGYSTKAEHEQAAPTNFIGIYHCETILMNLYLLGKKREEIVDKSPDVNAVHLRLPSKATTDALLGAMEVLPVSKRCCPACHALVVYFKKHHKTDLIFPGNHSVWTAAALPPWIPREPGLEVIEFARKALQERFKTILELKDSSSTDTDA